MLTDISQCNIFNDLFQQLEDYSVNRVNGELEKSQSCKTKKTNLTLERFAYKCLVSFSQKDFVE